MEGYLSLFSLIKKSEGVTIKGMKYELANAVVHNDDGVSRSEVHRQLLREE